MCKVYGYVRVSTKDQNVDRQVVAMQKLGIRVENIFIDKQSGKDFNRIGYKRLLRKIKTGDVLYVKSIDRLGRNYEEIIEQWKYLTKKRKIDIVIIDMPLLDTRYAKDLLGTFISDLVLNVMSFSAELQRTLIKESQEDGIAVAKEKGVKFGRPVIMELDEFRKIYMSYAFRGYDKKSIKEKMGFTKSSFYRYVRRCQEEYGIDCKDKETI